MENKIIEELNAAKKAYYKGTPIMSDRDFDDLEESLRLIDPNSEYFNQVGTDAIKGNKVKHKYPMLSMGKAKSADDVQKWLNKILTTREELVAQPKIDGLSCSIVYMDGKVNYISTRGDGVVGQDITHIKKYINIPTTLESGRIEVRGELYLPKNTSFPNPDNKPLRNLAVGLINRKTGREDLKYVKFVAYQIFTGTAYYRLEQDKLRDLRTKGFKTVWSKTFKSMASIDSLYDEYLNKLRNEWEYETDGLVITVDDITLHSRINSNYVVSHHNHYNIALKPPSESKETKLIDIEWNMSRQGSLIPVGILESVNIGGANISRVSLHNYKTVQDFGIRIDDKVLISRANDVIPYFIKVIQSSNNYDDVVPERCPSCGHPLYETGVHLVCSNHDGCPSQLLEKIIYWVSKSDMDGVSESTITTLYQEKIISKISDLYHLKESDLQGLDGFGEKKISNLIEQIKQSKEMSIENFISKLGIDLVGEKAVKKMGITSIEEFMKFSDTTYKIGLNLIQFKSDNKGYIDDLISVIDVQDKDKNKASSKGLICMTGSGPKGRKELTKDIENMNYEITNSLNGETSILLCEDPNGSSSKLQKARKLGIKIMSYEDFLK